MCFVLHVRTCVNTHVLTCIIVLVIACSTSPPVQVAAAKLPSTDAMFQKQGESATAEVTATGKASPDVA